MGHPRHCLFPNPDHNPLGAGFTPPGIEALRLQRSGRGGHPHGPQRARLGPPSGDSSPREGTAGPEGLSLLDYGRRKSSPGDWAGGGG